MNWWICTWKMLSLGPSLSLVTIPPPTPYRTCALPPHTVTLAILSRRHPKPMPGIRSLSSAYQVVSMCFGKIMTSLGPDLHHNVGTAEASGRFYFPDKDQLLFPVLKTKVEQTQRSSVFILTMQELYYVFATTSGHYLSTCPFFLTIPLNCLHLLIMIFLSL